MKVAGKLYTTQENLCHIWTWIPHVPMGDTNKGSWKQDEIETDKQQQLVLERRPTDRQAERQAGRQIINPSQQP